MCSSHDRKSLADDFNAEILEGFMDIFLYQESFKTLGKKKLFSKMQITLVNLIFFDNSSADWSY